MNDDGWPVTLPERWDAAGSAERPGLWRLSALPWPQRMPLDARRRAAGSGMHFY